MKIVPQKSTTVTKTTLRVIEAVKYISAFLSIEKFLVKVIPALTYLHNLILTCRILPSPWNTSRSRGPCMKEIQNERAVNLSNFAIA